MTSLHTAAATDRAMGDDRSTAQLVADHFVARLTGQVTAARTPVAVNLVVSAETLLGGDDEPADLTGPGGVHGPVPASVARGLVHASPEQATRVRRLFRLEDTDHLVAMDSVSRTFDGLLKDFITRLVQRPDPHHRPRHRRRRGRPHQRRQRAGPVRGLQPDQGDPRLAPHRDLRPAGAPPRADHHPHRTHPPLPRTRPTPSTRRLDPDRTRPLDPRRLTRRLLLARHDRVPLGLGVERAVLDPQPDTLQLGPEVVVPIRPTGQEL